MGRCSSSTTNCARPRRSWSWGRRRATPHSRADRSCSVPGSCRRAPRWRGNRPLRAADRARPGRSRSPRSAKRPWTSPCCGTSRVAWSWAAVASGSRRSRARPAGRNPARVHLRGKHSRFPRMSRRILVLGSGGREHALAWRLARDPGQPEVVVAPGNEGIGRSFRRSNVRAEDPASVVELARREAVSLVVVGPEAPLAAGVADALASEGFPVAGAAREPAQLESSKWFAKQLMTEAGVPTAAAEAHSDLAGARAALGRLGPPWVVKADGLAAGKGVLVTEVRADAEAFARDCLERGRFGASGARVVIERFLEGEEASVMAVCDGTRALLLPAARDYKRAFDGDRGPNTGGMGAVAPAASVTPALEQEIADTVFGPVLRKLASRGTPYRGVLYAGLMLTGHGPQVVEFNVRFGDPEAQSILPLLEGSLSTLLESAARGALEPGAIRRAPGAAVTMALVDEGYPDAVSGGGELRGLDQVERTGALVFHAATRRAGGEWVVAGGRAAYVTALGATVEEARARLTAARGLLSGEGWRARGDIAAGAGHPTKAGDALGTRGMTRTA